jgi:hypothetical protein
VERFKNFYFFPSTMELTNEDVAMMRLVQSTDFHGRASELFNATPGRDAEQMMRDLSLLCRSLSTEGKLKLNAEVIKRMLIHAWQTDTAFMLERMRWFLAGVHGRAVIAVLAQLWSVFAEKKLFDTPRHIVYVRALVAELVERFYIDWTESSGDRKAAFSHDSYVAMLHTESPKWYATFNSSEWRTRASVWVHTWDESVACGHAAYTAKLSSVFLSHTPLPDVLTKLIIGYLL